jgi:hypothetical protein
MIAAAAIAAIDLRVYNSQNEEDSLFSGIVVELMNISLAK